MTPLETIKLQSMKPLIDLHAPREYDSRSCWGATSSRNDALAFWKSRSMATGQHAAAMDLVDLRELAIAVRKEAANVS